MLGDSFLSKDGSTCCGYIYIVARGKSVSPVRIDVEISQILLDVRSKFFKTNTFQKRFRPKEALAIRRIFSLVDMITKAKISNVHNDFKNRPFGWYNMKYVSKRFIIYKALKTCAFYSRPSFYVFKLGVVYPEF